MSKSHSLNSLVAVVFLFSVIFSSSLNAQAINDFGAINSTNWSSTTTWGKWNGSAFVAAGSVPGFNDNVFIPNGKTVTVDASAPFEAKTLTVVSGGKLYTNTTGPAAMNRYITMYGDIVCNGIIGNGAIFDPISFNIDGASCTISGSGSFDASRIRKKNQFPAHGVATTNLLLNMNINLRFNASSQTQIYNEATGTTFFNVTIAAGTSLNLLGTAGGASMDGLYGVDGNNCSGSYTINGTLNVSGTTYLTTNNVTFGNGVSWIINNGGVLKTSQVVTSNSLAACHLFRLMPGAKFEIYGTPGFNSTLTATATSKNVYDIRSGSFVEFSGAGTQNVPLIPSGTCAFGTSTNTYGYLKISGSLTKTMFSSGFYKIDNDLNIVNTTGTPTLDCNNQRIQLKGNWNDYSTGGFLPQSGVVEMNGANTQIITCPGGENYYDLRYSITGSPLLQFNSPVTVADVLNWTTDGPILLNGNLLTMSSNATTAIDNSLNPPACYIISELTNNTSSIQWNIGSAPTSLSYVFPFGTSVSGSTYIPFTYQVPASTNVGNLKVATYGTPPDNLPWPTSPTPVLNLNSTTNLMPDNRDATVDRFWQIDATGPSPVATVTFTYQASELPTVFPFSTPNMMDAQWYNAGVNKWQPAITGQTSGSFFAITPGLNTYGPWALAARLSPLPIELLSFTATNKNVIVELDWSTASEINNKFFTLERSTDGKEFTSIGIVAGAGNSTIRREYIFNDENPLPGVSYYRLVQTDFDGTKTISNTVVIRRTKTESPVAYPQPAKDNLFIGGIEYSQKTIINLLQADGRLVRTYSPVNNSPFNIDVNDLSPGIYFVQIISEDSEDKLKFMKQ